MQQVLEAINKEPGIVVSETRSDTGSGGCMLTTHSGRARVADEPSLTVDPGRAQGVDEPEKEDKSGLPWCRRRGCH